MKMISSCQGELSVKQKKESQHQIISNNSMKLGNNNVKDI